MSIFKRIFGLLSSAAIIAGCISSSFYSSAAEVIFTDISQQNDLRWTAVRDEVYPQPYFSTAKKSIISVSEDDCYIYNMLETEAEKNFYNALLESCETVDSSAADYVQTPSAYYSGIDQERAVEIAWLFHYSHPEFFWCDSSIMYGTRYVQFCLFEKYQDGAERASAKAAIETEIPNMTVQTIFTPL